ncbi:MAG: protoporphyrinogen oxidase HemJ [Alphaproteobacteria bacterium]|nr:protoporphyrinogen oxidase HemJ [Alphaproteobacteria bacterium]
MSLLVEVYLWIKALHVIAVIAWMAALLYLPRLFVYHAGLAADAPQAALFVVMERRLRRGIMDPAMAAAVLFGVLLLATPGVVDWASGWIWVKLLSLGALGTLHGAFTHWQVAFAAGRNHHSARFYRFVNEAPALLMVIIVVAVIVKPL